MAFSHVLKVYDEYGHQIPIMGIRGHTGAKIISTQFIGEDEHGNYQYLQTFDNGHRNVFTAPRGEMEKVLMGERIKRKPSQRELTAAVQLLWQKLGGLVVCLLVCLQANAVVTRDTEWRDVPPETLIKDVVDLSASGGGVSVTNAVNGITTNGTPVVLDAARIAHIVFPTGGSSGGVTPAQVTNIWNALAGSKMVPQYDDNLSMTAAETLFVSNIFQVGETTDNVYQYVGAMAHGFQVNGQDTFEGKTYEGMGILGPGVLYLADTASANNSTITPSNIVVNGKDVVYGISTNGTDYLHGNVDISKFRMTEATVTNLVDKFMELHQVPRVNTEYDMLEISNAVVTSMMEFYDVGGMYEVILTTYGGIAMAGLDGNSEMEMNGKGAYFAITDGSDQLDVHLSTTNLLFRNNNTDLMEIGTNYIKRAGEDIVYGISTDGITYSGGNFNLKPYIVSTNGLASTNYVNEYVAEYVNTDVCWSKPNLWCLEVELGYTATVAGDVTTVTNGYGAIWETKSVTYAFGNYADLYPEVYDEYSFEPVVIASYRCLTPGGTISASGRLTTVSNATYLCAARDTKGVESTISVPIQSSLQTISDVSVYKADLAGSARKAVNDAAKTLMTSPTSGGTGTYEGITYNIWNHFTQPAWALTQAGAVGCVKAFALGTTVMASAAHYSWHAQGQQTVGSTTVTKGQAERLYDWALTNGWNKAQLDEMNIRDIEVIPLTAGTIPLNDLPYLMTEAQLNATYGGSLEGIQCWTATQSFQAPLTRVFKNYYGKYGNVWSNYSELGRTGEKLSWRDDLTALITALGTTYPVHSGDSGHPIYFKDAAGRFVLTSHFYSAGGGPNYIKGYPVIKAYVEAHGGQIRSIP